jgi:pimeloyl-ACP methyl ester carboxylesterase
VLITHGASDAAVSPGVVEQHTVAIPHAQVALMPGAGHAPFYDDPSAFNQRLRRFARA